MKVCVLQHVEPETPGLIADVLADRGLTMETVRTFLGEPVPSEIGGYSALIVMGGPMGVYECERHPHLRDEIRLIQRTLEVGKPILGVCLGSQLLASALGATVAPARKEIGWLPVTLSEAGSRDFLWAGLENLFTPFHWHGDAFQLPPGTASLASSDLTPCQAFRHGRNAYGFLFHMEVDQTMVQGMVGAFCDEMKAASVDVDTVLASARERVAAMHRVGRPVFERWAGLIR